MRPLLMQNQYLAEDESQAVLPTIQKMYGYAILATQACMLLFLVLAVVNWRKSVATHFIVLFLLTSGLSLSLLNFRKYIFPPALDSKAD
jgi:hypothetical protein